MKKIKKPIHTIEMDPIIGDIIIPEDNFRIEYSALSGNTIVNKYSYRVVFDSCIIDKMTLTNLECNRFEFIDCINSLS